MIFLNPFEAVNLLKIIFLHIKEIWGLKNI